VTNLSNGVSLLWILIHIFYFLFLGVIMSLFVEVKSVEKGTKVVINLDHIVEIAPLREGGCALFFNDGAAVNGIRSMKVEDSYAMFTQFAMQTVSSEMIADRIAKITPPTVKPETVKPKTKAVTVKDKLEQELEIPKFGQ
jgi:hypothetical protein